MLKTGKKIFHRHAWKEKTFVLRARAFDDRNVYVGPVLEFSCAGEDSGRYALDGCGVRGFEKPATIWAGSEPRDAFRFDVVERRRGTRPSRRCCAPRPTAAPLGFAAADELAKGIADVERDVDNTDFLRTGLCGVVIHGGFLIHKRKKRRYFKARAVAFDDAGAYVGPRLEYAVEEDDDVVLGTYLLDGARVEAGEGSGFDLRYDRGTVALVAASAEDRSEWLLALEEALSQHHDIVEALRRRSGPAPRGRSPATPQRRSPAAQRSQRARPDSPALFRFGVGRPADEFQCEFQCEFCEFRGAYETVARSGGPARRGEATRARRRRLRRRGPRRRGRAAAPRGRGIAARPAVRRRRRRVARPGARWRRAAAFTASAGDYAGPALLEECGGRVVATPLADRVARPCDPSGWDLERRWRRPAVLRAPRTRGRDAWTAAIGDALAGHGRVLAALGRGRAPKTPLTHDEAIRRALEAAEHRYAKTEPNKKYGPRLYSPFQDPRFLRK
ncbi:hypothetical protein SO694_00008172 [Aureococcus anophagefferens]|uniref:PH domain-containing protein n=1 Tax=Aureococcus anophagefferens TaxID=44056 RepID=A0ABR1GE16_AURAN